MKKDFPMGCAIALNDGHDKTILEGDILYFYRDGMIVNKTAGGFLDDDDKKNVMKGVRLKRCKAKYRMVKVGYEVKQT